MEANERGCLVVDENYMTTCPGVFAAGDVGTGVKTVVHAVEAAKNAAQSMMQFMERNVSFVYLNPLALCHNLW